MEFMTDANSLCSHKTYKRRWIAAHVLQKSHISKIYKYIFTNGIKLMSMMSLIFTKLSILAKKFIEHQNVQLFQNSAIQSCTSPDDVTTTQELYLLR